MSRQPGRSNKSVPPSRPTNRFWIRGFRARPGAVRQWALFDAATGDFFGEKFSDKELIVLEQQLRQIRAKHNESVSSPMIWDGGPL